MRRWLALSAIATTSIVVLAFLVPLAALIQDLAADRALASAEREAQTIAQLATTTESADQIRALEQSLPAGTTVVLSSNSYIGAELPAGVELDLAIELGEAFRQPIGNGQAVIVPVLKANESWIVVVAVPTADLMENVFTSWLVLAGLGLALIVVAAFVADRLAKAVVSPIKDLVDAAERLGAGELSARVAPSGPSELVQVGTAFNTLSARVRQLLEGEREAAADLSHRLRTPLTVLKLDLEALESNADIDLSRVQQDVDDLERTVGLLISESRRPLREGAGVVTDLKSVVEAQGSYWGFLADDQGRAWTTDLADGRFPVSGVVSDYVAAIDAIIGNIYAHTPPGTGYSILLRPELGVVHLSISDSGAGISDRRLLERGRSGTNSSGLGIDIVRNTVEAAGGSAEWNGNQRGGTTVDIRLPLV